jgi:hypothetical protein
MIRVLAGLMLLVCQAVPAFAGFDAAAVNSAEFKQPSGLALDRAIVGKLWHSRHAKPFEGQQIGIARLRAPHQLGRRQAGEALEEGHRGRFCRARGHEQEVTFGLCLSEIEALIVANHRLQ